MLEIHGPLLKLYDYFTTFAHIEYTFVIFLLAMILFKPTRYYTIAGIIGLLVII